MFSIKTASIRIKVISISDRPSLYTTTFQRMHDYCIRHNYILETHFTTLASERHISWSKIPALLAASAARDMDYVVWIDDDICITDVYRPLESFIISRQFAVSDACIMISAEPTAEPICNCGMMICKVGPELDDFLGRIWREASMEQWWHGNWEQDVIAQLLKEEPHHAMIVPHRTIQSFVRNWGIPAGKGWMPGDFAAHITGMPLETRIFYLENITCTLDAPLMKNYNSLNAMLMQMCPTGPSSVLLISAPDCIAEYSGIIAGAGICHNLPMTYDKIKINAELVASMFLVKIPDEIIGLELYNMLKSALEHVRPGGWLVWYAAANDYLELVKERFQNDFGLRYECKTTTGWNAMRKNIGIP